MKAQRLHALLLIVLLGVTVAVVRRSREHAPRAHESAQPGSFDFLVEDAAVLVTVDVASLSRSELGRSLLERLSRIGAPRVGASCATAQLQRVRRMALAVPARVFESGELQVALVADGDFEPREVLACATRLLETRPDAAAPGELNGFAVLRDRRGGGELAVRDGGPLIVSGGEYFRDLLDRVHHAPAPVDDTRAKIHRALVQRAQGAPFTATALLPRGWLGRWLEDPEAERSPLAKVRAVLVSGRVDQRARLELEITCDSPGATEELQRFVDRLMKDFGAAAADLSVERAADRLRLTMSASDATVLDAVEHLQSLAPVLDSLGRGRPGRAAPP